jgi:hypothetical protein
MRRLNNKQRVLRVPRMAGEFSHNCRVLEEVTNPVATIRPQSAEKKNRQRYCPVRKEMATVA